jgi:hypothetical protein
VARYSFTPATPGAEPAGADSFATSDMDNPLAPRRVILVGQGDQPIFALPVRFTSRGQGR